MTASASVTVQIQQGIGQLGKNTVFQVVTHPNQTKPGTKWAQMDNKLGNSH